MVCYKLIGGVINLEVTMRYLFVLLLLVPVHAVASVLGSCSVQPCNYFANETVTGNVMAIDFGVSAQIGSFTLNETLLTDFSNDPTRFLALVRLTFVAEASGFTHTGANLGGIFCDAVSSSVNPDSPSIVHPCYQDFTSSFSEQKEVPIQMIIAAGAGSGNVFLRAAFYEVEFQTSQMRPVNISFAPAPEPGPVWLCAGGPLGLSAYRMRLRSRRDEMRVR
jgi:hypothetical protein